MTGWKRAWARGTFAGGFLALIAGGFWNDVLIVTIGAVAVLVSAVCLEGNW